MEIHFRTTLLQKAFENHGLAARKYGEAVARKYVQRVTLIKQARSLEEIMAIHGLRCHPLKGNRKGQYAISLDYRYRLIFTVSRGELEVVWIEEVSKHYDD
jgi:proteic killer suppression protein